MSQRKILTRTRKQNPTVKPLHMYVCIHIFIYIYIYIHLCVYVNTHTYIYILHYIAFTPHTLKPHTYRPTDRRQTVMHTYIPTHLPTYLPAYLPARLLTCLPAYLPTYRQTDLYKHTHAWTSTHTLRACAVLTCTFGAPHSSFSGLRAYARKHSPPDPKVSSQPLKVESLDTCESLQASALHNPSRTFGISLTHGPAQLFRGGDLWAPKSHAHIQDWGGSNSSPG